jgi:hypothetical protein
MIGEVAYGLVRAADGSVHCVRTRRSIARGAVIGWGLGLVWGLSFAAGVPQPGYEWTRDSLSALAAIGAESAWIGMLAIGLAGAATIAASLILRRISPPGALTLVVAGGALIVIAGAQIQCHGGAAGCHMVPELGKWKGQVHLAAVGLYELCFVAAIGSAAISLWRAGLHGEALIGLVGMLASLVLFAHPSALGFSDPDALGLYQRMWLASHSLMIVGLHVCEMRARRMRGPAPEPAVPAEGPDGARSARPRFLARPGL